MLEVVEKKQSYYQRNPEKYLEYRKKHRKREAERAKQWRLANRGKYLAANKRYAEKNKLERRNWRLQHEFGITATEYDEMLASQGGVCAICGGPEKRKGFRLSVDHDHATGKVRGILCTTCNASMGHMGDDAEKLRKAADYLDSHNKRGARTCPPKPS